MFIENDLNQQSKSIYLTDPLILRTWSSAAQLNAINRIIFSHTKVSRAADQHSAIEEDFFYGFWAKSVEPRYCRRMWTMLGRYTIVILWNTYDPCNYSSFSVPVRADEWKRFEAGKSSGTWILKTLSNTVAKRVNYGNHQWQVFYLVVTRKIHSWKYRMMLKLVLDHC